MKLTSAQHEALKASKASIKNLGKAQWTYTCRLCGKTWTRQDKFSAVERKDRHEASLAHLGEAIAAALRPATEVFRNLGLAWGLNTDLVARSMAQTQAMYGLVPPPVTPRRDSPDAEGA